MYLDDLSMGISWEHTYLEGVKFFLQCPKDETFFLRKSAFQELKKYVFQQNWPVAFWVILLKPQKNWKFATF